VTDLTPPAAPQPAPGPAPWRLIAGVVALDDDRLQKSGGRHAPTIHNDAVGFDATRKQVKRKTDILFVVGAIAAALALVAWGFFG